MPSGGEAILESHVAGPAVRTVHVTTQHLRAKCQLQESETAGRRGPAPLSVGERRAIVLHELEGRRPTQEAAASRKQ